MSSGSDNDDDDDDSSSGSSGSTSDSGGSTTSSGTGDNNHNHGRSPPLRGPRPGHSHHGARASSSQQQQQQQGNAAASSSLIQTRRASTSPYAGPRSIALSSRNSHTLRNPYHRPYHAVAVAPGSAASSAIARQQQQQQEEEEEQEQEQEAPANAGKVEEDPSSSSDSDDDDDVDDMGGGANSNNNNNNRKGGKDHHHYHPKIPPKGSISEHQRLQIVHAYQEAKARGLPQGWTCTIDKRNRRKWTAPSGKSCDSIPKALAISVELGLLPADTVIPVSGKRKRSLTPVTMRGGRGRGRGPGRPGRGTSAGRGSGNAKSKTGGTGRPRGRPPKRLQQQQQQQVGDAKPSTASSSQQGGSDDESREDEEEKSTSAAPNKRRARGEKKKEADEEDSKSMQAGEEDDDDDEKFDDDEDEDDDEADEEEDDDEEDDLFDLSKPLPPEPMNPENSFNGPAGGYTAGKKCRPTITELVPTTVHWDPTGPDGSKIGWKVRIALDSTRWLDGRITRYDPFTHKHKIQFIKQTLTVDGDQTTDTSIAGSSVWIWIRNEQHNLHLAVRMVWAHVKGYAWWPALVLESNTPEDRRDGYCLVEFFGTGEISTLRDSSECIRPFHPELLDSVVSKHKKKRNSKAFAAACAEWDEIRRTRNDAAVYYAQAAFRMANICGGQGLIGKRVQIFRSDVNYPYGDTVVGKVKAFSNFTKKWLLAFEVSTKTKAKYDATWINVQGRECALKILDGTKLSSKSNSPPTPPAEIKEEDLVPYLFGLQYSERKHKAPRPATHGGEKDDHGGKAAKAEQQQQPPAQEPKPAPRRPGRPPKHKKPAPPPEKKMKLSQDNNNNNDNPTVDGGAAATKPNPTDGDEDLTEEEKRDALFSKLLAERCRGCVEVWKDNDIQLTCDDCKSSYHLGCWDPPLSIEMWQRILRDDSGRILCSRCTPCRGCYEKDITFGSHLHPTPATLSFPAKETLNLCSMCKDAYDAEQFCPNCAHSWDDVKFQKVRRQIDWTCAKRSRTKKTATSKQDPVSQIDDSVMPLVFGSFSGDDVLPLGSRVDRCFYYPETSEWGYTEVEMLVCDGCKVWVHAGCAGISEDEYDLTSDGDHPIYSKEFLCRVCCRNRCKDLIVALQQEDTMGLFAVPVTEKMAPNYHDLIKHPMDLQTMLERAETQEYLNYAWVRDHFELMVYNALTFNRYYTPFWNEAKRFYEDGVRKVFVKLGKAAPPGKYETKIKKNFQMAEDARKMEEERVQVDSTVEKKDLVAGSMTESVTIPKLREAPPDQSSCLPYKEVKLKAVDAFYFSWMDCCYTCGTSGAADTLLFCVDCGEAFHSFCVNAPVHSMEASSVAGWRCPNCKICEISGDVPQDETRMLFCEMCDRAFSLDLLEPPLKAVPSGLWICGQCVDCKVCGNTADPRGASLKYWSRDPEKCYCCGGCNGIVDESAIEKCGVCEKMIRGDDKLVLECDDCATKVHCRCDTRAKEHYARSLEREKELVSRSQKARKIKIETYQCPSCYQPFPVDLERAELDRKDLSETGWRLIVEGKMKPHDNYSNEELHEKLMAEIELQIRDMWREEYITVIREALRVLDMVKAKLGEPRMAVQQARNSADDIPEWTCQRASRFIIIVKRAKWAQSDIASQPIDKIVSLAKLAASFIRTACCALDLYMKKTVACNYRIQILLKPPDESETFWIPLDSIRGSADPIVLEACELEGEPLGVANTHKSLFFDEWKTNKKDPVKLPSPLRGWRGHVEVTNDQNEWKDPRECCLCHLCGDDDAGFHEPDPDANDSQETHLGRLLPMSDGFWVHTACALWSSEVWEDAKDGLIHAADKARGRGAQLKCFGCGRHGATVGCNKGNCNFNYHFLCAKACGAVFDSNQQVFCATHKSSAAKLLQKESFEFMKAMMIAPEKKTASTDKEGSEASTEGDLYSRVGTFVIHSLGSIETNSDGFHSENYIFPPGYTATRIFWSTVRPRSRTLYVLKIERSEDNRALFTILPGDNAEGKISGHSASLVYSALVERVRKVNADYFNTHGDMFSKLPMVRKTRRKTFGLNGPQFFGFGLNQIRRAMEITPGVEVVVVPLTSSSLKYRFCFVQPTEEAILDLHRKRAAAKAEEALENTTGCARTEGIKAVTRSGGSGRITRALVRKADEEVDATNMSKKGDNEKTNADRNLNQVKYRRMKSIPIEQRLVAKRSHIHGWGLFTKMDIPKDNAIVEYMGEIVRQPVADKRERAYEVSGEGSCYMFRLDLHRIVDATMIGCMARFMNHSCQPNAYAKIIRVDTDQGQEKKIVVFANRNISSGEEITYDYKFPVEDGSLKCTCGAPNCIGRLN